MTDPYRPIDEDARRQARALLASVRHGALATMTAEGPSVSRAGVLWLPGRGIGMLLSDLSDHARALRADAACAILVGDVPDRGDPLTHPRITLRGRATMLDKAALRDIWLAARPKATLYMDFTDFAIWCLIPVDALLNAGFGKAYRLTPDDLGIG